MKITPWDFDKTIVENKKRRTRRGPPFRGGNIFVVGLFLVFFAGAGRNISLSNAYVFLLWNIWDQMTLGHQPDRKASSGSKPSGVLMTV
jgi:hypothetical protein